MNSQLHSENPSNSFTFLFLCLLSHSWSSWDKTLGVCVICWVSNWYSFDSITYMSSLNWSLNSPFNWCSLFLNNSVSELCNWTKSMSCRSCFNNLMSHRWSADNFGVFNIIWRMSDCMIILFHNFSNSVPSIKLHSHCFICSWKCIKLNW